MNELPETRAVNTFQPSKLVAIVVAGLVVGMPTAIAEISLATLVFSGGLQGFVPRVSASFWPARFLNASAFHQGIIRLVSSA